MSIALSVSGPHPTSPHVATFLLCMRSIGRVLRLQFEAFRLSLLAFASQVPANFTSALKFTDGPTAYRLSLERALDAIISWPSCNNHNVS